MKRLKVAYILKPGDEVYWDEVIVSTIRKSHDVHTFDAKQPVLELLAGVDGVVQMGAENPEAEWVEAARGAKLWQLMSVGYDKFDIDKARQAGIPLCHCPGVTTSPGMAESALMLMLLIAKKHNQAQAELAAGQAHHPMGEELAGRLLGLIGLGASGNATARLAKAFGMRIAIAEPMQIDEEVLDALQPEFVVSPDKMDRVFEEADIVSLHLPLTPDTRGCIGAGLIGRMKPTACFINTARGDLVDQEALYRALLEDRIGGIGTDVHAGVLPDSAHPVYRHPHFYAMPHVSGSTTGTVHRRARTGLENLNRVAQGEPVQHRIDQG